MLKVSYIASVCEGLSWHETFSKYLHILLRIVYGKKEEKMHSNV